MALIQFQGFENFQLAISVDLPASGQYFGWTGTGSVAGTLVAGQLGGFQWSSNGGTNNNIEFLAPSPLTTFIVGFRLNIPAIRNQSFMECWDSTHTTQMGLGISASGKLYVWRGSTANVVATGTTTIVFGGYYYVELKCTINTTTGSCTVNLNGVQEINATNVNTQATGNANVQYWRYRWTGAETLLIDDWYLEDTTGSAPYNGFLCDPTNALRIETLYPTANSSVFFTPNTSTNVSQVQEVHSDNDTTFNVTSVPAIDTFTHGSLVSTPVTIYAINVLAKLRSDDVSNMTMRTKLTSGATSVNGTTWLGATVYQYIVDQYTTDPNTSAAWATAAAVNGTIIGYERIT